MAGLGHLLTVLALRGRGGWGGRGSLFLVHLDGQLALEPTVPRLEVGKGLAREPCLQPRAPVDRVVVGHVRTPARRDARGAIDEPHREDRKVELGLLELAFVLNVGEQGFVLGAEDLADPLFGPHFDVAGAGCVLLDASLPARAELPVLLKVAQVVGAYEVLGHGGDGVVERCVAVVVVHLLRRVRLELRHTHHVRSVGRPLFQARTDHLALPLLEPVHERRDVALDGHDGVVNEGAVNVHRDGHGRRIGDLQGGVPLLHPLLALVGELVVERHAQALLRGVVGDNVERLGGLVVVLDVHVGGGAEPLVVVVVPRLAVRVGCFVLPQEELAVGVELEALLDLGVVAVFVPFPHTQDRRKQHLQEAPLEQTRVEKVKVVDDEARNVLAVVVGVGHDAHLAVAEALIVFIVGIVDALAQANHLLQPLHLPVIRNGGELGVHHVDKLATQAEQPDRVDATFDLRPSLDTVGLGRVALGDAQDALAALLAACPVARGVARHGDVRLLLAVRLGKLGRLLLLQDVLQPVHELPLLEGSEQGRRQGVGRLGAGELALDLALERRVRERAHHQQRRVLLEVLGGQHRLAVEVLVDAREHALGDRLVQGVHVDTSADHHAVDERDHLPLERRVHQAELDGRLDAVGLGGRLAAVRVRPLHGHVDLACVADRVGQSGLAKVERRHGRQRLHGEGEVVEAGGDGARQAVVHCEPRKQVHVVLGVARQPKVGEVERVGDRHGRRRALERLDHGCVNVLEVATESLHVAEVVDVVLQRHGERLGEHAHQLDAQPVEPDAAAHLRGIVVGRRQKVGKDHLRHPLVLLLVLDHGDGAAVVGDRDRLVVHRHHDLLRVEATFAAADHGVGRIRDGLVKAPLHGFRQGERALLNLLGRAVVDPHLRLLGGRRANVHARAQEHVLTLGLLVIVARIHRLRSCHGLLCGPPHD